MEMEHDEAGTDGATFASAEPEVRRHAPDIDGVRERSKGDGDDWRGAIDRVEDTGGRERYQRAKESFDWRTEDLGVWGDKTV